MLRRRGKGGRTVYLFGAPLTTTVLRQRLADAASVDDLEAIVRDTMLADADASSSDVPRDRDGATVTPAATSGDAVECAAVVWPDCDDGL